MQNTLNRAWTLLAILAFAAFGVLSAIVPAFAREESETLTVAVEESAEATAEAKTSFSLTGQLIELSSTDAPTTLVVRKNPGAEFTDYTVDVSAATAIRPELFPMSDWITGDFLLVQGTLNENTGVVTATRLQNLSINPFEHKGLNGWVESVDAAGSKMVVKWEGKLNSVAVTANTKMVVGSKNPAALSDFAVGDRVRLRLVRGSTINEARIIVVLRRGDDLFLKARTRSFSGTLETLDAAGSTLTVRLKGNKHLRGEDVNNLVGVEDELVTVTYDENTKIVRKYDGEASIDEFAPGDQLFVVGRVGDNGVISARMIKNESIFKRGVSRHLGKVTAVDVAKNEIKVKIVRKAEVRAEGRADLHAMMNQGGTNLKAQNSLQEEAAVKLRARVEAGTEWTVTYADSAKFMKNGRAADENSVTVGDMIRVVGVANATTKTIVATHVFATSIDFKPFVRERPLKEIVQDRIRTSLGKMKDADIVDRQEPEDAIEAEVHDEMEMEM